jgi:DNA-binding CsgD family transcriptional regulator
MSHSSYTEKDLRMLSRAASKLYQARTIRELILEAVATLPQFVSADNYYYGELGRTEPDKAIHFFSHPEMERLAQRYTPVLFQHMSDFPDMAARTITEKHKGKVVNITDQISIKEFEKRSSYIQDYARPMHSMRQLVYYTLEKNGYATFMCGRNGRDYSDREKVLVEVLGIHLEQAYQNVRAFEKIQLGFDQVRMEANAAPRGVIWLDEHLRVREINPQAAIWLGEFFPQARLNSKLPARVREWLQNNLRQAQRPRVSQPIKPLVSYSSDARLTLRSTSWPEQKMHLLVLERHRLRPTLEDLHPLGLTRRESEVLLWVAQGKTNGEIARILGGSRRTIDKHVEHLLAKLKLENRANAVLLVADLLQG